jgi:hypothetical protein
VEKIRTFQGDRGQTERKLADAAEVSKKRDTIPAHRDTEENGGNRVWETVGMKKQ